MESLLQESCPEGANVVGEVIGRPIVDKPNLPFTDQIYGIMTDLIQRGHWKVGERLPSIAELSAKCTFSRRPFELVFNQLADEGYLRQEGRRGSFLESMYSKKTQSRRTVGLVLIKPLVNTGGYSSTNTLMDDIRVFGEVAAKRNYQVDTAFVDWDTDLSDVNTPSGLFKGRVCGVFLMNGMTNGPEGIDLSDQRVPVVYINSGSDDTLIPSVNNDTWHGMYRVTQKVIDAGHRRIAVLCDPPSSVELSPPQRKFHQDTLEKNLLHPHRLAMRRAGLEVNEEAIAFSSGLPCSSLSAIRDFLERFSDVTCIIALRNSPMNVIGVAELLGRKVPEELSVVAGHTGPFPMRENAPGSLITGMALNPKMIEVGFDFLEEIQRTGDCRILRAKVPPRFVKGGSLAAPGVPANRSILAGVQ